MLSNDLSGTRFVSTMHVLLSLLCFNMSNCCNMSKCINIISYCHHQEQIANYNKTINGRTDGRTGERTDARNRIWCGLALKV